MRDENEALKRNLTGKSVRVHTCEKLQSLQLLLVTLTCDTFWTKSGLIITSISSIPPGENCYYFSTRRSSWKESRSFCKRRGGDLVKIDSREEKKMDVADDLFWIGLTDSKTEGEWLWVDDSPLNTSFWMSWEPDNWTGEDPDGENCARMGVRGGATDLKCWFDKSCKVNQKYICEKEAEIGEYMVSCV
uniref:C-type lectin domain-containing protein n=1 Tax=Lates calcarifer TaxID=8187 RepID=A0A4W6CIE0_LATCA